MYCLILIYNFSIYYSRDLIFIPYLWEWCWFGVSLILLFENNTLLFFLYNSIFYSEVVRVNEVFQGHPLLSIASPSLSIFIEREKERKSKSLVTPQKLCGSCTRSHSPIKGEAVHILTYFHCNVTVLYRMLCFHVAPALQSLKVSN